MSNISRINVIGTSGSGKSTFAKELTRYLNYQYIEMDKIFWGPNWHWPSDEEFFDNLKKAISTDTWVLDGNYTRSIPIKWDRTQMVIWLDYSFGLTLFRAIKRALKRSMTQEEIWEGTGNRETFRKSFFSKFDGAAQYILAGSDEADEAEPDTLAPVVIAEMETKIPSITVGEAVMQLELAGHRMLVFRNEGHGGVNVVYRRDDGNIGWIDPRNSR